MTRRYTIGNIILTAAIILIAVSCLYPLWYTVAISLSDKTAVESGYVKMWPVGFTLSSYSRIVADMKFANAFLVSVERVLLGGGINYILTVLMAFPIARSSREFRDKNKYVWFLLFCMLFQPALMPAFLNVKSLGLMNSIWALALPAAVPVYNIIILSNFYKTIPKELDEAAYMDGASIWYVLLRIYIPLSMPAIATVTLYSVVYHWNEFFCGLIYMTDAAKYPLQTYIQQLVVVLDYKNMTEDQIRMLAQMSNRTLNSAKIIVAMIPILLIYPFLQRYFVTGITIGSVKE